MTKHRAGALKRQREAAKRERRMKKEDRKANRKPDEETETPVVTESAVTAEEVEAVTQHGA